jgi:8-oxo-dGTP diphosphatase
VADPPAPTLCADLVLFAVDGGFPRVLLVRRGGPPYAGSWALPGGQLKEKERFEDAARREIREKTGVDAPADLTRIDLYDDPDRDPRGRVVSVAFAAVLPHMVRTAAGVHSAALWTPLAAVLASSGGLAFDHDRILDDAARVCGMSIADGSTW